MGSIYIYDVGTAPFRAPWALYRGSEDIEGLRDDLLAIVDEPEFADTESNILRDAQGSDEYDLYRDLVDRKIDYFLIATGGSMDQLVAVRSKDDFRRFIDHMEDHYAADVYVGEDEDRRLIRASSGKFVYHNPGLLGYQSPHHRGDQRQTKVDTYMRSQKNKAPYWRLVERENPLIYRDRGLIVPNDYSSLWFHGSDNPFEDQPRTQFSPPRTANEYDATFFTPSQGFAESFAERNLEHGGERGGFVYACRVYDVKIFDVDDIFENMEDPNTPLTEEGVRFLTRLSHYSLEADTVLRSLRTGSWEAFHIYDSVDYDAVINTMEDLGYRGWVEFEISLASLALMYPEDDVEIVWSYRVGDDRENPSAEYTLIYESELDDFDEFEGFYGVDPEIVDPWRIVRAVNLGVSSRKEFYAGHLLNGQLVSALFVAPAYADCFSFDVAVLPEYQSRGLGTDLVDTAIEVFEMYEYSKDDDFEYCVQVVNPHMKSLLERKGFYVVESTSAGDEWIMERSRT
jgi:GNAT superfamily N-acetyltransferase